MSVMRRLTGDDIAAEQQRARAQLLAQATAELRGASAAGDVAAGGGADAATALSRVLAPRSDIERLLTELRQSGAAEALPTIMSRPGSAAASLSGMGDPGLFGPLAGSSRRRGGRRVARRLTGVLEEAYDDDDEVGDDDSKSDSGSSGGGAEAGSNDRRGDWLGGASMGAAATGATSLPVSMRWRPGAGAGAGAAFAVP